MSSYQEMMDAYERGDYDTALKGFRPLAEQGDAAAQYFLGVMYAKGHGSTKDYVLAHMWFSLAAARGDKVAIKTRDTLEEFMTPDQIAEAQRLAREWKAKGNGGRC